MVTAELAACLPVLVLLLGVALSAVAVVATWVRAQDAAREAARAAARGDSAAAVRLARSAAPGAVVTVTRSGDEVSVRVRARARPLGGLVPGFTVTGEAVAAAEPGSGSGFGPESRPRSESQPKPEPEPEPATDPP